MMRKDYIGSLPPELVRQVCRHLPVGGLVRLESSSASLRWRMQEGGVWQERACAAEASRSLAAVTELLQLARAAPGLHRSVYKAVLALRVRLERRVLQFEEEADGWLKNKLRNVDKDGVINVGWLEFDDTQELEECFKFFVEVKKTEIANGKCQSIKKEFAEKMEQIKEAIEDVSNTASENLLYYPVKERRSVLKAPRKKRDVIGDSFRSVILKHDIYKNVDHLVRTKLNFD